MPDSTVTDVLPDAPKDSGDFGAIVKQLRLAKGFTLADVAQRINVTVSYISLLENGRRRPSEKIIAMFKEAYSLSPDEESRLLVASGFSEDSLTRTVKFLTGVIESEVPADEIDRALMIKDLLAVAAGWRELLYGKHDLLNGQFSGALRRFSHLADSADLTPALSAAAAVASGDVAEKKGELETAEQQIQRAETRLKTVSSKSADMLRSEATGVRGMILLRKGHYDESRTHFDESMNSYVRLEGSDDTDMQVATLVSLTKSYNRLALLALLSGEPGEALSFCDKAESYLARVNTDQHDRRRLRLVALRAWANMQQNNFKEARKLHTRALEGYEALHDEYGVAKNRLYLGDDYRAEAESFLREDELAETGEGVSFESRRRWLARGLESVAVILDNAESCYRDAVTRLQNLGENNLRSRAYRSLGDVLRFRALMEDDPQLQEESMQYLRRALDIETSGNLRRRLPTTYESLARLEWDKGEAATAASYFGRALGILADPKLEPLDTSGKILRTRCARARNLLLWQLSSTQSLEDKRLPKPWQQIHQRLIDTVLGTLLHGKYRPVATSSVHPDWASALEEVERIKGPRLIAQNLLSTSLSTAMPAGAQVDTADIHRSRHDSLLQSVSALAGRRDTELYRDICWKGAVNRAMALTASEELCRKQAEGALQLLEEKPVGYRLLVSEYELPLGFMVKGSQVLLEVPAKLVSRFDQHFAEGITTSSTLCYHITDNQSLAGNLSAIFDELAKFCDCDEKSVSHWLRSLLDGVEGMQPAVGAL